MVLQAGTEAGAGVTVTEIIEVAGAEGFDWLEGVAGFEGNELEFELEPAEFGEAAGSDDVGFEPGLLGPPHPHPETKRVIDSRTNRNKGELFG
jgi:hypothetical protein